VREAVEFAILRGVLAVLALLAAAYVGDYCSVRYQIPHGRQQFGQVTVNPLYAIPVKGGKIHYEVGQPEVDTCVHSLFPHFGYNPCWYAIRHTDKIINI
jgi:hypothetical protein